MSVAARALETPKSCSDVAALSSSRSSCSSWRMASGMASSHRGVAGIGKDRAGYNLCSEYELGRVTAGMLCAMLVDDRPERKIYAGMVGHPIKRVMGRRDQATDPAPAPGAAARTRGGPAPGAWHRWPPRQRRSSCPGAGRSRASGHRPARRAAGRGADGGVFHRPDPQPAYTRSVRHGRDAILRVVRRARARARTAVTDHRGHLHRRDARPVSRPHDHAAPGLFLVWVLPSR